MMEAVEEVVDRRRKALEVVVEDQMRMLALVAEAEGQRMMVGGAVVVELLTRMEVEVAEAVCRLMGAEVGIVCWEVVREEHCCGLVEEVDHCLYQELWVEVAAEVLE